MKSCAASPQMRRPESVQTGAMPVTRLREKPSSERNLYCWTTSFSASCMLSKPARSSLHVSDCAAGVVLMDMVTEWTSCMTRCAI